MDTRTAGEREKVPSLRPVYEIQSTIFSNIFQYAF